MPKDPMTLPSPQFWNHSRLGVLALVFLAMAWMFYKSSYNLYAGIWFLLSMYSLVLVTNGLSRLADAELARSNPERFRWQINIISLEVVLTLLFGIVAGYQSLHLG